MGEGIKFLYNRKRLVSNFIGSFRGVFLFFIVFYYHREEVIVDKGVFYDKRDLWGNTNLLFVQLRQSCSCSEVSFVFLATE